MSDLQGQVNTKWGNCEELLLNISTTTKNTKLLPTTYVIRGKVMLSAVCVLTGVSIP